MAYRIFSTLDDEGAVLSPVIGPPGEVVDQPSFEPAFFSGGVFCDHGYVRFPTRLDGEEFVSNAAGSISLWLAPHFGSGQFTGRMVVFSLYNDQGSNIIVFFDADQDRFGFSEAGVGEALESSSRTVSPDEPIKICLTWNGAVRRLAVYDEVRAEQAQGAEFIPDRLVLGAVEAGSVRLTEWRTFEGALDNLKVEDVFRTDFTDLDSAGARTEDARAAFARTVVESARGARLSAPVDNQRNSYLPCSGSASMRWCSLRTGGRSVVSAGLEVRPGDARGARLSAPAAAARNASATGCGEADSGVLATLPASSPASGGVSAACTGLGAAWSAVPCGLAGRSDALDERAARLQGEGTARLERLGAAVGLGASLSGRGGVAEGRPGVLSTRGGACEGEPGPVPVRVEDGRRAKLKGSASALDFRGAACPCPGSAEGEAFSLLTGAFGAFDTTPAAVPSSGAARSERGAAGSCDLPRSRADASLVAAEYDRADWLGHLLAWMEDCCAGSDLLAPAVGRGFRRGGFGALASPAVRLVSSDVYRMEEAAGARWTAELEFEIRSPRGPDGAARLAAAFVRSLSCALDRGAPPGAAGPVELETHVLRAHDGRWSGPLRLRITCRALVVPAAALI